MQCNIASGSIAVLSLEVLEQSFEFDNWQRAGTRLAICTAHAEEHQAGPRALLHGIMPLRIADSTPAAKLPNLIPCQLFQLYGMLV